MEWVADSKTISIDVGSSDSFSVNFSVGVIGVVDDNNTDDSVIVSSLILADMIAQ